MSFLFTPPRAVVTNLCKRHSLFLNTVNLACVLEHPHVSHTQKRQIPPVLEEEKPQDRNTTHLGTFDTRAVKHEREVEYFDRR